MLPQQQSLLPRPPQYPPNQPSFPFSHNQYSQGGHGNTNQNEQYERRGMQRSQNNSHEDQAPRQQRGNRFGKPGIGSKEEYAADLERQITEKNERKIREKRDRGKPEGGFLGMGETVEIV
jgi:hypothetical protein